MNDNKEYLIYAEESGSVRISEEVIATMVHNATLETEGVSGLASGGAAADISDFFTKKNKAKGIKISFADDNGCNIDVAVLVKYGFDVKAVAGNIQQSVKSTVESMAQLSVKNINVFINGITFADKTVLPQA